MSRTVFSIAVERANSGLPESPPASVAPLGSRSPSRAIVVLETIMPSMPDAFAAWTISASATSSRSGAILRSSGTRRACASRASTTRAEQPRDRFLLLKVAQPRRVGRGDVDRQVVGDVGEAPHARDVVRDPVLAVLVGADVDADDAGVAPPRQPRVHRVVAVVVEAEPVDERAVVRPAGRRAASGCPAAGAASPCRPRRTRSRDPARRPTTSPFLS